MGVCAFRNGNERIVSCMNWKLCLRRGLFHFFVNNFCSFYTTSCSVDKVVSETGWRLYNVASDSLETQQELLKQWFGSTSLFAFQSVGCWKGNLIQQAPRLDWQYTLRLLVQKRRQQTLSYSQSIPLIFIELSSSEIDLKKQIAACGIREPVIRLGSLKDWLVLTDQLDLNNNWKTLGLNCLQRNHASWLFQSEQELFYGFHDSLESASHTIHSVAENGQQSLHQLILQAELPTKDKNELHNVDKVASSLRFNALDSWYTFRELEYQKRLAYAVSSEIVILLSCNIFD